MHSTSSGVTDGATPPSSPPAHHFEIGDDDSINGDGNHSSSNGNAASGEYSFENDVQNGGGDADAPSPYQVFRTPVSVDFAESSVVAPCDLPEGHNLRVDLGRGRILVVQVPFGGAKKGDTFYAPYRIYDKPDEAQREYKPSVESPRNRSVGAWRASLCGCCEFGPCHPTALGAFICQCCKLSFLSLREHHAQCSELKQLLTSPLSSAHLFVCDSSPVTSADSNASELLGTKVTTVDIASDIGWGIPRICDILLFQRGYYLLLGNGGRRNKYGRDRADRLAGKFLCNDAHC